MLHNALTWQSVHDSVFLNCLYKRGLYITLYVFLYTDSILEYACMVNCPDIPEGRIYVRKLLFLSMKAC